MQLHIRNLIGIIGVSAVLWTTPAFAQNEASDEPSEQPVVDPLLDWGSEPVRPRPATTTPPRPRPEPAEPTISFGGFSEPIELTTLIDFVGSSLNVNIVVKGSPTGEVVFNAPVEVPKSKLIDLLDAMLEQYAFTIAMDEVSGFYIVQPVTDVRPTMSGERASTRIIHTPNIKPSLIVPALTTAIGGGGTGGAQGSSPIQAVDELGVLIINAPPRDISRIEALVGELIRLDQQQEYIRLELNHLAAPVARERIVGLAGGSGGTSIQVNNNRNPGNPNGGTNPSAAMTGSSLNNLSERVTIDPQGNALIFKGTQVEADRVRALLAVIDVPNTLQPKNYFAGSSAAQIADIASRRGLGEVILIEQETQTNNPFNFNQQQQQSNQFNQQETTGGPVMVVDPARGNIVYYGTREQQAQLAALMVELGTEDERIVTREYILNHSNADTIADLLIGIITGERQTGDSPLLPQSTQQQGFAFGFNGFGGDDASGQFDPNKISVIPDPDNNQVIIRAPIKQQDELQKIIAKLDKRKSQVYIEAMIVAVNDNEDFLLSVDTQLLGDEGGFGTNFGNLATPTAFTDPRTVAPGLGGLTAALIKTDFVPVIINASQTNTDVRILSTPQLLVNDNQEAEIVSIEEQPFSELSQDNATSVTSFGGYAEAGTTLRVTPSISKSGFLRLEYYVELSNFTSATGIDGSPPPRNTRRVEGSASVPTDSTIVLGGIVVDDIRDTIIKVPLLGDIPILGEAFKRTNKVNNKSRLYIFLTPRIMTDPNFNDIRLFTEGPQRDMSIDPLTPTLEPEIIQSVEQPKQGLPETPWGEVERAPAAEEGAPSLDPVFIEVKPTTNASGSSD
ncbi:MAG: hypothetical protein KC996_03920 [Phycisphaerales bacterium]|nr:hypothetical protein [Phycisphaerales bacterium]